MNKSHTKGSYIEVLSRQKSKKCWLLSWNKSTFLLFGWTHLLGARTSLKASLIHINIAAHIMWICVLKKSGIVRGNTGLWGGAKSVRVNHSFTGKGRRLDIVLANHNRIDYFAYSMLFCCYPSMVTSTKSLSKMFIDKGIACRKDNIVSSCFQLWLPDYCQRRLKIDTGLTQFVQL